MAVEVRKVFLMDEQGNVIDCLLRSSFFNDLAGLGYDDNVTYMDYGDGFFSPVKRSSKQGSISGKMSFLDRGTAYADYRRLMNWVSTAETLRSDSAIKLCYRPYGSDTFTKDVLLTSISKGEIDVGGFLTCNVTFTSLTPWYSVTSLKFTSSTIGNVAGYNLPLYLDADTDGRYMIELSGSFAGMSVRFRDSTGTSYGFMDMTTANYPITGSDTLVFSTIPNNIGIWKRDSGGTLTNLIDQISFADGLDVFPLLKNRENLTLLFRTTASSHSFTGNMNVYSYWKTR